MKFSPKCRTKKLGTIYTFWEVFVYFLTGKGPIFGPKSGLGKYLSFRGSFMSAHVLLNLLTLLF